MANVTLTGTDRTPDIHFDFEAGHLKISGESYPEDVTAFYGPVVEALETHLEGLGDGALRFDFALIYFNSSSAKIIMTLMELLDEAAESGAKVDVYWYFDPEDDTMEELGEEFGEDLEHATFHLESLESE